VEAKNSTGWEIWGLHIKLIKQPGWISAKSKQTGPEQITVTNAHVCYKSRTNK